MTGARPSKVPDTPTPHPHPTMVSSSTTPTSPAIEEEKALISHGQRRINLKWENTQTTIAIALVFITALTAAWIVVYDLENRLMAFLFLSNAVSTVIGFYFGRTNHQKVGGVPGESVGR